MVDLYNLNDGVHGRDGGPYLDQEQARTAEKIRARLEDREPDLDNPPPHQGSVLVTADALIANFNNTSLAGDDKKKFTGEITAPVIASVPDEVFEDDDEKGEEETPNEDDTAPENTPANSEPGTTEPSKSASKADSKATEPKTTESKTDTVKKDEPVKITSAKKDEKSPFDA